MKISLQNWTVVAADTFTMPLPAYGKKVKGPQAPAETLAPPAKPPSAPRIPKK